jgi:hypothetical protein
LSPRSWAILAVLPGLLGWGCASKTVRLPTHPLTDAGSTLALLKEQADGLKTVSGEGRVTLTRTDGQSIRLDAALAVRLPDHVRLRAWKLGQAALDLTLTPDGMWMVQPGSADDEQKPLPSGLDAERFARMWRLFAGSLFGEPDAQASIDGDELIITLARSGEPKLVCRADRATLTPRQYDVIDDEGRSRFVLRLERYGVFGDRVFPCRIVADSAQGRIVVDMPDPELNQDLPDGAFVPPRRARKAP